MEEWKEYNIKDATFDLHDMISKNREESRRLATLRDTLLPRLMSGELRVPDMNMINELLEKE